MVSAGGNGSRVAATAAAGAGRGVGGGVTGGGVTGGVTASSAAQPGSRTISSRLADRKRGIIGLPPPVYERTRLALRSGWNRTAAGFALPLRSAWTFIRLLMSTTVADVLAG